ADRRPGAARMVAGICRRADADGRGHPAHQGSADAGDGAGRRRSGLAWSAATVAHGAVHRHCGRDRRRHPVRESRHQRNACMSDTYIALVIVLMGIGSLLARAGYLMLGQYFPLSKTVSRCLRYAPVAALTAIIVP